MHTNCESHASSLYRGRQSSQDWPVTVMAGLLKGRIAYLFGASWALAQLLDAAGISGSRSLSMSLLLETGALHTGL